jgi:hypothetical protein
MNRCGRITKCGDLCRKSIKCSSHVKTIVFGLDNFRADHLQYLGFMGGVQTVVKSIKWTLSGPSWTSILTDSSPYRHGVWHNTIPCKSRMPITFLPKNTRAITDFKCLQHVLIGHVREVKLILNDNVIWKQLNSWMQEQKDGETLFMHVSEIDHTGHKFGVGPEYTRSVIQVADKIKKIMALAKSLGGQYKFKVRSDHGLSNLTDLTFPQKKELYRRFVDVYGFPKKVIEAEAQDVKGVHGLSIDEHRNTIRIDTYLK